MRNPEEGPTVLVVERDDSVREEIAEWLMQAGYMVLTCPGPRGPSYACLGGRGLPCPLAHPADVVVVDLRLESDLVMVGSPGWQLMLYYLDRGHRVVALAGDEDFVHPRDDEGVTVLRRPASRPELLAAVRGQLEEIMTRQ